MMRKLLCASGWRSLQHPFGINYSTVGSICSSAIRNQLNSAPFLVPAAVDAAFTIAKTTAFSWRGGVR